MSPTRSWPPSRSSQAAGGVAPHRKSDGPPSPEHSVYLVSSGPSSRSSGRLPFWTSTAGLPIRTPLCNIHRQPPMGRPYAVLGAPHLHRVPRSDTVLRPRRARAHPRLRLRPVHAPRLRSLRLPNPPGQPGILLPAPSPPIRASRRPITTPSALAALSRRVATRILVSPALPRHLVPHPTSLPATKGPLNFLSVK